LETLVEKNSPPSSEVEREAAAMNPGGDVAAASPARGLSVRHNFAWTLAGTVTYALSQWIVIVLLAKLGNAAMVGRFALALAVAYPITYIAHLQLRVVFVTDQESKFPAGEVLGLRLMLSALAIVILVATCKIAGYGVQTTAVILIVGVAQLLDCLSENYYAISQKNERMDRIAKSQIFRSLLSLTLVSLALHFTHSLMWGVVGYVISRSTILLTYDSARGTFALAGRPQANEGFLERIHPYWNLRKQLGMAWIALPLGAVTVLGSLNANMPRYFIEKTFGPADLGIFSALNYIPVAAVMVCTALGYAAFARLSKLYFAGDLAGFKSVLGKAVAVCGGMGLAGLLGSALLGRQILTILYRPQYAEHVDLLLWLMAVGAVACVASCMGCAMSAAGQFRQQVPLFMVVTGSSFVACYFLIPWRGLQGAALAALVSMCVQLIGTIFIVYRALQKRARALRPAVAISIEPALESQ
jgi:O-antigen/teichoic acid export membrane protein